jgi:DNA-directed RNA polymerase III subunit RPC5
MSKKIDEMEIDKEEEEEEDYVVQRFDVSLSHNLTENLYCFQYPLRPPSKGYDFNTLRELRYKKDHQIMEMDFELNTKNEHYDTESSFDQRIFTLQSSQIPLKTNYCVGVLRGDQFHITPLKNILQLRPKLEYLSEDKHVQEKVTNKKKTTSQPRLVYATMQTKEDEETRKKSYEYAKQMEQSEPWVNLKVYQKNVKKKLKLKKSQLSQVQ